MPKRTAKRRGKAAKKGGPFKQGPRGGNAADRLTYEKQNPRIVAVGRSVAELLMQKSAEELDALEKAQGDNRVPIPEGHIEDATDWIAESADFGAVFRAAWSGQDEWFSTSTVDKFIQGAKPVISAKNAGPQKTQVKKILNAAITNASCFRFETRFSGFNLGDDAVMQHPTGMEETTTPDGVTQKRSAAIFGEDHGEARRQHRLEDIARRQAVLTSMEAALPNGNANPIDVFTEGIRASISYTLNAFVAPAEAENVSTLEGRADQRRLQTERREAMKALALRMGVVQENGDDHSASRVWTRDPKKRSISPLRNQRPVPAPAEPVVSAEANAPAEPVAAAAMQAQPIAPAPAAPVSMVDERTPPPPNEFAQTAKASQGAGAAAKMAKQRLNTAVKGIKSG